MGDLVYLIALFVGGGYLLGSISTAVLVSRALGTADPRAGGSGNPGATNVLRLSGRGAAAFTLAGDVLKGVVPVLAARIAELPPEWIAAAGLAAFLGHLYPVFFGFKGGKGAATAAGALFAMDPLLGAAVGATWLLVAGVSRYSSMASLASAVLAPAYAFALSGEPRTVAAISIMSVLLVWRHRGNIRRLMTGEEGRIGGAK